jgi:lysozyme
MANEDMHLSAAGYSALRQNEGVVMRYYNDAPTNGNCTWGVGTLAHYGPCTPEELQRTVTPAQVDAILDARVRDAERMVRTTVSARQLTQAQFDAAVSFAYNSRTQDIQHALRPANEGDLAVTPRDLNGRPVGAARINHGLVNRRARESAPFDRDGH